MPIDCGIVSGTVAITGLIQWRDCFVVEQPDSSVQCPGFGRSVQRSFLSLLADKLCSFLNKGLQFGHIVAGCGNMRWDLLHRRVWGALRKIHWVAHLVVAGFALRKKSKKKEEMRDVCSARNFVERLERSFFLV